MSKFRRFCALLLALMLVSGLAACGAPKETASVDVLTQKPLTEGQTVVTVLVKNAFAINTFEKEVEEKFPHINIVQVSNYTSNMGIAEYTARLEHSDLTDIVMTWPLDVGSQYWDEQLLDLSALPLTGKYNTAMLDNISRNGKLFYLPGPAQVRGILYNKTMFKENGWVVPSDFDGFIKLCKEIEASGIRSLQLGLGNAEVLDTAFVGYGYESSFSNPKNAQALADYNDGKGSFADNFTPALETFQTLIDEGVLKKEDLGLNYTDRELMMFTRKCAMVEDSVLMARMGLERTGITDEFGLMPFFNAGEAADWARIYPVCYIGLNKQLDLPENKEKKALAMQLLEYISTPEGQEALAGDTGAMYSSLNGVAPPDIPEIDDLLPALTHGRTAIFPTLKNAQGALREGLAGMVAGTMTAADVIKMTDAQNAAPPVIAPSPVLGSASADFSLIDTGNFVTDTMRAHTGSDVALFLDNGKDGRYNGKGVNARLYQGDITAVDVKRIIPDWRLDEKGELLKVTMTGEDLIKTLEYSIPVNNDRTGWFYYFSGLRMDFAPAAEPGTRIRKITDDSGKEIDPARLYTVAVIVQATPAEFHKSSEDVGIIISDLLTQTLQKKKTISPAKDGRFNVVAP